MICILYRSWFVLATMGSHPGVYLIDTVIPIFHASIEAPDNGRGEYFVLKLRLEAFSLLFRPSMPYSCTYLETRVSVSAEIS